jgi:hypothetical protein
VPFIDSDEDPGWQELQRRMAEALAPFAKDLGARVCEHGDWSECADVREGKGCLFADTQPKPGSMPVLAEWTLVSNVVDMSTGRFDFTGISAPDQRATTTNGLLWTGLNGI